MIFKRLRRWWTAESQKMESLSVEQRISYIWDYYSLWIVGILSGVLLLSWGIWHYVTTNPENWFFACFANTHADLGDGSEFWEDFADYAGYDLNEKNLVFNDQCYCDPAGKTSGNEYYQMLTAYMVSGDLDVLVMEKDRLQVIGASGRLMDLDDERVKKISEQYKERLIYCEPSDQDYGKESVPIGIDLSGSILTEENQAYADGAALGINAMASHIDQIEVFLAYLFEKP
ncbi:hypothetical protein ABXS75_08555 [Roseburia hominis]